MASGTADGPNDQSPSKSGVLVVCAHPDDAEIMLGGSIAGWCASKVQVTIACVATSELTQEAQIARRGAAERSTRILGSGLVWLADQDLMQVEDLPQYELVGRIDEAIDEVRPSVVISHWEGDSHFDHHLCAKAVTAASRRHPVSVYEFGTSELRTHRHSVFEPNLWIDITPTSDRKYEALREFDYPGRGFRSLDIDAVESTDRYRGLCIGVERAESLRQVRGVLSAGARLVGT